MEKLSQMSERKEHRIEWTAIIIFLFAQFIVGVWGAATMHQRLIHLEDQANKGGRFTAGQGVKLSDSLAKLSTSVGTILIWQAKVQEHMNEHDENASFWIRSIQENTKEVKELKEEMIRFRVQYEYHQENHVSP